MTPNEEKAVAVIQKYANGAWLGDALKDAGLSPYVFGNIRKTVPSIEALYHRARETRADTFADEIVQIADSEIDPVKGRVRVDARKWAAGVLNRQIYGDKVDLTVNKGLDLSAVLTDVQRRRLRHNGDSEPIEDAQVIETARLPSLIPTDNESEAVQGGLPACDPFEGC